MDPICNSKLLKLLAKLNKYSGHCIVGNREKGCHLDYQYLQFRKSLAPTFRKLEFTQGKYRTARSKEKYKGHYRYAEILNLLCLVNYFISYLNDPLK